jgi:hypothetical protein
LWWGVVFDPPLSIASRSRAGHRPYPTPGARLVLAPFFLPVVKEPSHGSAKAGFQVQFLAGGPFSGSVGNRESTALRTRNSVGATPTGPTIFPVAPPRAGLDLPPSPSLWRGRLVHAFRPGTHQPRSPAGYGEPRHSAKRVGGRCGPTPSSSCGRVAQASAF